MHGHFTVHLMRNQVSNEQFLTYENEQMSKPQSAFRIWAFRMHVSLARPLVSASLQRRARVSFRSSFFKISLFSKNNKRIFCSMLWKYTNIVVLVLIAAVVVATMALGKPPPQRPRKPGSYARGGGPRSPGLSPKSPVSKSAKPPPVPQKSN